MSTELPAIVGLTGGIASGKSTISQRFLELGAHVIDADAIARFVVEPQGEGLRAVRAEFGDSVIGPDGSLDRARLGEIIFASPKARETLNAILHPLIALEMRRRAQQAATQGHTWVIYDAALIVENGIQEMLQGLIVVACSPETQLKRLLSRDHIAQNEALRRINAQLPLADKVAVADWVIDNETSFKNAREQVDSLFAVLARKFGRGDA